MALKVLASLGEFWHPLLHILGRSTKPLPTPEFPEDMSVVDWESSVLALYHSRAFDRSRINLLKVLTLRRYKELRGLEHEYMIARISFPGAEQPRYLRIERSGGDALPGTIPDKQFFHAVSVRSPQPSLALSKKLAARDHVKLVLGWPILDRCIEDLNCSQVSITLLNLALVAKLVHDHSERYTLLKQQCFFFADIVVAVLQELFSGAEITHRGNLIDGRDADMQVYDSCTDKYKWLKIYSRQMEIVNEIKSSFDQHKLLIDSSVYSLNEPLLLLTNKSLQILEAGRLAEEADKREEAGKRVEEAGKWVEEAREEASKLVEEAREEARKLVEEAREEACKQAKEADERAEDFVQKNQNPELAGAGAGQVSTAA